MSAAKQCDRCKKFYSGKDLVKGTIDDSLYEFSLISLYLSETKADIEFDLCPRCAQNLYEWLACRDKLKD